MPLPSLPDECLSSCFSFLDKKTLYKCLFINRYYCKLSIPIIWRDPFMLTLTSSLVISPLLACLNEDEISSIIPCIMNLKNQSPLFEYGKFVRKIDHEGFVKNTITWLKSLYRTKISYQDCRVQKLVNAIYQMIMRQGSLKEFNININSSNIDLPKFSNFITHKPGITNLRSLKIALDLSNGHMKHQNAIEFLGMMPKFCSGLVNYNLVIDILSGIFIEPLLDVFKLQPLQKIKLNILKKEDFKNFVYVLKFRSETLTVLFFIRSNFQDIDLSFLSNLKSLEHLKFKYCNGFTSKYFEILSMKKLHLKELNLQHNDITSDVTVSIINSLCGKALLRLSLSKITLRMAIAIRESCPNISFLCIQILSKENLNLIISLICELSLLNFLHIKVKPGQDDIELLLVTLLCENLKFVKYLWLDFNINLEYFKYFTNNCRINLEKLAITDIIDSKSLIRDYLKCINNYQKIHKSLRVLKFKQITNWGNGWMEKEMKIINLLKSRGIKCIGKLERAKEL